MEPSINVFFTKLINVCVAIDRDVVPCLCDVDTIKHIQQSLSLKGNGQLVIYEIEEDVGSFFIRGGNGKIVNLAFEDDSLAGNGAGIQTWLMGGRSKTKFAKDCVGMLLPKTG